MTDSAQRRSPTFWSPQITVEEEAPTLPLRLTGMLWRAVADHVRDLSRGEQAGALLVATHPTTDPGSLTAIDYLPVPEELVLDRQHGMRYDGRFHFRVAARAAELGCGAILVHSHPGPGVPRPSRTDRESGRAFLAFMSRRTPAATHGLLIIGDDAITGVVHTPRGFGVIDRVLSCGPPVEVLRQTVRELDVDPADRQLLAIGAQGQARLALATVAVVGISGGGSHVAQQLIHAGVGRLIAVDDDVVSETNLRRLVGAVATDVDRTRKPQIPVRLANQVRPTTIVIPVEARFPAKQTLEALRECDVIIGCVDGWDVRDALNDFALSERIPYVDIGATVIPGTQAIPMRIAGQVAVVLPGGACLRCRGTVTDERVTNSRAEREGYVPIVASPQVISVNGTLASEAVTAAMMLLAGAPDVAIHRRYAYPPGVLRVVEANARPTCPACRAARISHPE